MSPCPERLGEIVVATEGEPNVVGAELEAGHAGDTIAIALASRRHGGAELVGVENGASDVVRVDVAMSEGALELLDSHEVFGRSAFF